MSITANLNKREKIFVNILLFGFLFKYNYLFLRLLYVPSITGVVFKNIIFLVFILYFLVPYARTKQGRIFLFILSVIFSSLFMSNLWYNRYFGNFLSINNIILGEGTGTFSIFSVLIRHLLKPYDILFLLDIIFSAFLISDNKALYKLSFRTKRSKNLIYKKRKNSRALVFSLILLLLVSQILVTNYILGNSNPLELYKESTIEFANVYGILPLYTMEVYDLISPDSFKITEAVDEMGLKPQHTIDPEALVEKQSNIIAIQLESFDAKLIDYEYQGKEVTPFINKLVKEGLYFNNFYAQHINGSFDADLSFLTSLYPISRNYAFSENDFSDIDTLAKTLKENSYQTMAFHGNDKSFFSRDKAYPSLGFDKFYSFEDYSLDNLEMEIEANLGINDYDFFYQSLDMLNVAEEPFFAYFITLSSHTPFDFYPLDESKEEFSEIERRLVRDYFNSIAFLDKSLEMFFTGLEERGLMEDTLFILYGDHESDIETDLYSSSRNFNLKRNVKGPENVPLLIIHPDIEKGRNKNSGSFTDLAPTILDILGIEEESETFAGKSLLADGDWPVLFLHENPQILYNNQLFVKNLEGFERIGYLDSAKDNNISISEDKKVWIDQVIKYMRNVIFERKQNILRGEE